MCGGWSCHDACVEGPKTACRSCLSPSTMWDPRTELITKLGNKKFYQLGQIATMKEVNVCNSEPLGFKNLMSALCSGEILVDIT